MCQHIGLSERTWLPGNDRPGEVGGLHPPNTPDIFPPAPTQHPHNFPIFTKIPNVLIHFS
jgi:hypothetical protein